MVESNSHPSWAKLYKVTEISRCFENSDERRGWYQYILKSDYSKMVGKRFGTAEEVEQHAQIRATKLNERLLSNGAQKSLRPRKK